MSIGNQPSLTNNVAAKTISVTASGGQTLFTVTGGYRINQISVYRNGTRLVDSLDYTARDGATVTLLSPASTSDVIEFQVFDDFRAADALNVNSGGTVNGNVTVTGSVTAGSFSGNITGTAATFTGNVTVGGTLTYEDVTNIDSVGLITARSGAIINTGTATTALIVNGDARVTGILTIGTSSITLDGSVNQVNVGTGVTIHHTNGVQVGNNTLHSTGLTVNNLNSSGIITATTFRVGTAVTINSSGMTVGIITATTFSGDGSGLTGVGGTANVRTNSLVVSGVSTVAAGSTSAPSITPSGDSNTGIFFPAADTIAFAEGGTEVARIDSSGRLLAGTSSARTNIYMGGASDVPKFQFEHSGDNYSGQVSLIQYTSVGAAPTYTLGISKSNTPGTNAIVAANDTLGTINFVGNDGTNFRTAAQILTSVDNTPGTNDMPGRLVFSTTLDGASSPGECMRINSRVSSYTSAYSRQVLITNGTDFGSGARCDVNEADWKLYTYGYTRNYNDQNFTASSTRKGAFEFYSWSGSSGSNSNAWNDQKTSVYVRGWLENGNPGEAASVLLLNGDWSGAVQPGMLIKGYQKSSTYVFEVHNNGNVKNLNNSYAALSDEILKQDIVDAGSQWEDIKNIRVRKFKFKKDVADELEGGAEATEKLGVIAQELELVSPGLVDTPPGHDVPEEEKYKSVKYSILYMKAVKALQEAQLRIESLEDIVSDLTSRVTNLEG